MFFHDNTLFGAKYQDKDTIKKLLYLGKDSFSLSILNAFTVVYHCS